MDIGIGGRDLFIGTLAGALSAATKVKEVIEMKKLDTGEIVDRYVYPATLYGLVKAITKKARVEEGVKSSEAMLYLVVKSLAMGAKQKVVTSDDVRIFSIGTGVDLSYVARNLKMFRMGGREEEGTGASLAKRKTLILIEPPSEERIKVKDFLDHRELDPENPKLRCSVDALHLLEYYAVSYGKEQFASKLDELRKKYPAEVDEAITLARIISGSLTEDIEAKLCSKILDKTTQYRPSQLPLTEYLEGEK
jgi:putative DNA methylase